MKETVEKVELWINNTSISSNDQYEIKDPGRLTDVVAHVAKGTVAIANDAVQAAHQAFLSWRKLEVSERINMVMAAASALEQEIPALSPLLVREHGGLMSEAQIDLGYGVGVTQFTAGIAKSYLIPEVIEDENSRIEIQKVPRGVVVAIVPWNFPIVLTMMKLAPALVTGNTIVVKPSPLAPIGIMLALKKMADILPPGVINVVSGDSDVGEALTSHPLVRKISFTGGNQTAKHVMHSASSTIKNITLELGGNDPAIILDDANLDEIMPALVRGIFTRSGQICFAVKRVYVPQSLYEKFYETMCQVVNEIKVGHGLDEQATMGPVNNKTQYQFVKNLIEQAKHGNAKVLELGKKLTPEEWDNGYYILPTIIRDVEHTSNVACCEQFGPVIPLISYQSVEQAIQMANDSEFGLCSSVWSSDRNRALNVARQIEAGSTFINSHNIESLDLRMPFGGIKQSGIGREFSDVSLADYVENHSIKYAK
jgi:acyl-CoA reductase-like NAD-dependent aldehyde dehydrogenase